MVWKQSCLPRDSEGVTPAYALRGRPTNLDLIAELETACNLASAPLSHGLGVALPTQGLGRMHTYLLSGGRPANPLSHLWILKQPCDSVLAPLSHSSWLILPAQ